MPPSKSRKFESRWIQSGAGIALQIPFDPDDAWGKKDVHHIAGTVGACCVRGPLKQVDGNWVLALGAAWVRDAMFLPATVAVEIYPEGPQSDALATDISAALASAPDAKKFFDGLASFYRKGYIRNIEAARRPETRAARIAEMIGLLSVGKKQK